MGYITNQWVNTGRGRRNKGYDPVSVHVACSPTTDDWSKSHKMKVRFKATEPYGTKFQELQLSEAEANQFAKVVVDSMSEQERERLLTAEYQSVRLSETVADAVAPTVVDRMSRQGRERLVTDLLKDLTPAKLLRALAFVLRERVRLPKDH